MKNDTEGKTSQILSSRIKTVELKAVKQSRFKAYNLKQLHMTHKVLFGEARFLCPN